MWLPVLRTGKGCHCTFVISSEMIYKPEYCIPLALCSHLRSVCVYTVYIYICYTQYSTNGCVRQLSSMVTVVFVQNVSAMKGFVCWITEGYREKHPCGMMTCIYIYIYIYNIYIYCGYKNSSLSLLQSFHLSPKHCMSLHLSSQPFPWSSPSLSLSASLPSYHPSSLDCSPHPLPTQLLTLGHLWIRETAYFILSV